MPYHLHFLRPGWFWAFIPLLLLAMIWLRQNSLMQAWQHYCDPNLWPTLFPKQQRRQNKSAKIRLLVATSFMIVALAGPSGQKLETPVYETQHPRLVLLDLSDEMLKTDLSPNRLSRAKFKLHDLFKLDHALKGQLALMVFTSEPFVVSPFTKDAKTIDALIHELSPSIMPVGGMNMSMAIQAADELITQSKVQSVDVLLMTSHPPNTPAIEMARKLHKKGSMSLSVLPIQAKATQRDAFKALAQAGGGILLPLQHNDSDLTTWLNHSTQAEILKQQNDASISVWRDDGRWLLIPVLLCLLPIFRKQWLHRI